MSLLQETLLSFAEAAASMPSVKPGVKHLHEATVWVWAHRGVGTPKGTRIKLETIKIGGRWFTTAEALERFTKATTAAAMPGTRKVQTIRQRQKSHEKAVDYLKSMGCKVD